MKTLNCNYEMLNPTIISSDNCYVRGRGLMFAIEFAHNKDFDLEKVHRDLFDAGYITGIYVTGNLLRFYPPLTIEKEHITGLVDALSNILSKYNK